MTRIHLASNLKTRTGAPSTKDARIQNGYIEVKGNDSAVRKRPAAQGGVSVGTGQAQGGIGLNIGGTPYIYTVNGDVGALNTSSIGTTWSSGTSYLIGDIVAYGFVNYWAKINNTNSNPTTNPADWSTSYMPAIPSTFSPTILSSNYIAVISGAGLILSTTSALAGGGITAGSHSSGKYYFEASVTLANPGTDSCDIGITTYSDAASWISSGLSGGHTTPGISGSIIGVAIDFDGLNIYFYQDGVLTGSTSVTSGTYYAACQIATTGGTDTVVFNFGQSAFTYSPPAGYTAGF